MPRRPAANSAGRRALHSKSVSTVPSPGSTGTTKRCAACLGTMCINSRNVFMPANFLPEQYDRTEGLPINHNYLAEQFADYETIFAKIKQVVLNGDFTLGRAVDEFERQYAAITGTQHAIGVNSGTDALRLSLIGLGAGAGDEVITTPFT